MEETIFPAGWNERVGAFAMAVGKPVEEVTKLLVDVIGEPSEDALNILADAAATPDADIKAALAVLKIPSGKINMHLVKLRGTPKVAEVPTGSSANGAMQALAILPAVPDETSFIEMLKTGGVLKVDVTEVLSAVKAALAKRVGLFDLPEKIMEKMEGFAEAQEEPWGKSFFEMQKLLTQQRYGDVLSVLGVSGNFMSDKRKKEFFARLDTRLWSALTSFQSQLSAWQEAWLKGFSGPGAMMAVMARNSTLNAAMPSSMMAPPPTDAVRASAEEVVNEINRVFAGPGIPVARALAYDATRIMGILNDPTLPSQVGAGTKDQMLKELGITVGADIVRTEQSITRYCLAIMSLPKVTVDVELVYLDALYQLGTTIPWDKLGNNNVTTEVRRPAGIGRTRNEL